MVLPSSRTLAEWVREIGDWSDEKGWWEVQCQHGKMMQIASMRHWCEDCGGVYLEESQEWALPEVSRRNTGEDLMLMATELAEALEELRNHRGVEEIYFADGFRIDPDFDYVEGVKGHGKPEGFPVELVDVLIRLLDLWAHKLPRLDLEQVLDLKHRYNITREYRHGGKAS